MIVIDRSKYAEIGRRIRNIPLERPDSSYEWEELVQKMCDTDDTGLKDIGSREREVLKLKYTRHQQV